MACATSIKPKPLVRAQALSVNPAHVFTLLRIALTCPLENTNFLRPEARDVSQDKKFSHTASDGKVSWVTCSSRHRAGSWHAALKMRLTSGRCWSLREQRKGGGEGTLSTLISESSAGL